MTTRGGFTAIETIVSVVIIAVVGLMIGQTVMQISRSAVRTKESQRASELGDMVMEQYTAYAAQDYLNLPSHDRQGATPQAFFLTHDNLGYDNLRITTLTEAQETGGSLLTVNITWGAGTPRETLTLTKTFGEVAGHRGQGVLSGI